MSKNSLILPKAGLYCGCITPPYSWWKTLLMQLGIVLIILLLKMIFG